MITSILLGAAALATAIVVTSTAAVAAAGCALHISKVKTSGRRLGPITYAEFRRHRNRINKKKAGKVKKEK
jgi:hypothetical protein